MAVGAVIDEGRFEAGLDAGDDPLVDVALALLFAGGFDIEVNELLTINDGDAQLFHLRRVKQHSLHCYHLPRSKHGMRQTTRLPSRAGGVDWFSRVA